MCGEGKSDLFTAWFTNDDLLLVNSVGSISKLGNIEALVLNLVLTLNLGDLDRLGDTDLLGGRVGKHAGHLKGGSDKGDLVSLSLVFLTAYLVFSLAIAMMSISISALKSISSMATKRSILCLFVPGDLKHIWKRGVRHLAHERLIRQ